MHANGQVAVRQRGHLPRGAQRLQHRTQNQRRAAARRGGDDDDHHQAGGGQAARIHRLRRANRPGHDGTNADRQANDQRQVKKRHHPGKPDRRRDFLLPQPRNVKQIDQVHRKHGHQPHRASAGQHADVAHQGAGDEARRKRWISRVGSGHGSVLKRYVSDS